MNRKATIRRLIGYLKESKFLLLLACVTTIVANVLALYGPKLTGIAIDAIGGPGQVNFDKVLYYCVLMILFYVISLSLIHISAAAEGTNRFRFAFAGSVLCRQSDGSGSHVSAEKARPACEERGTEAPRPDDEKQPEYGRPAPDFSGLVK